MEISNHEERGSSGNKGAAAAAFMRPSSSRWIPTAEQIRILRDLYYNGGLRSPTTEQIQRISSKLRQFGKIEGKNVFYWFQNHKARERQKKRIINELSNQNNTASAKNSTTKNFASDGLGASSSCLYGVEKMGSSGYGSGSTVLMERSFREDFVVGGAGDHQVQSMEGSMGWMGGLLQDPAPSPWMAMYQSSSQYHEQAPYKQMETLQLFPIHPQDNHHEEDEEEGQQEELRDHQEILTNYLYFSTTTTTTSSGHHYAAASAGAASLELSLNSCCYAPRGST